MKRSKDNKLHDWYRLNFNFEYIKLSPDYRN